MMTRQNARTMRIVLLLAATFLGVARVASADNAKPAMTKPPAHAKPVGDAKINVTQLAVADRALEFCRPIDPDSSKKIELQIADMTKGASPDTVSQARSSEVYKSAYSSMDGFIAQIDPRNAKTACANTARAK